MAPRGPVFSRLMPAALLLLAITGCSGTNLGDVDEEVNSRESMPGPGILADDEGESALKWSSDSKETETVTSTTAAVTATATTSEAATLLSEQAEFEQYKAWKEFKAEAAETTPTSDAATLSPEQAEFEQYKAWKELKAEGAESAEYQDFQQWLEYQHFKSSQ